MATGIYDLLVVGGGINGAGIARDAAGRGLSVLLVEKDDLAAATSQWSTKLVHGGLRYLEHYEFRLVGESLAEREVLLANAPHLVEPLSFVLPHEPHLRPAWMIRIGLFLYDHLGKRVTLPGSFGVKLAGSKWAAGLKPRFTKGFVYADARVDDARLVVANVLDAQDKGADIRVRTRLTGARRDGGVWRATLAAPDGTSNEVRARAIVNAAGPWVKEVLESVHPIVADEGNVRHVKGSHIVVPRVHAEPHAYILQNADNRIVFVIPYQDKYSLIGTTDVPVAAFERPEISEDEIEYLLKLANAYLEKPLTRRDVVWTYSGVRPLYDDGKSDPSAITRDYVLKADHPQDGPPVINIFGGKITTYRRLAEHMLEKIEHFLGPKGKSWTANAPLPGGDFPATGFDAQVARLKADYPFLDRHLARRLSRLYGTRAKTLLGLARSEADLGRKFGPDLYEAEVRHLIDQEWAVTAEDVLWRRTKRGLTFSREEAVALDEYMKGLKPGLHTAAAE